MTTPNNTVAGLVEKMTKLVARLRDGDWNMRTPEELAEAVADAITEALASPAPSAGVGVEDTRVEFERWVSKRHGCGTERWADSGKYRYENTNEWWECWCAALQHPAAPSVEEQPNPLARYWMNRSEFWMQKAISLGWREVRDAANGEAPPAEQPGSAVQGEVEYEFEVWQDDSMQAGGSTTDYATAKGEADHYALMYGQDGPVEVRMYEKRRITTPPPAPAADPAEQFCDGHCTWSDHHPDCVRASPAAEQVERRSTHDVHRGPESLPCYCAGTADHPIGQEATAQPEARGVEGMVNRFLCWKLPDDFAPDAGISFTPSPHQSPGNLHWPIGTNLLTAAQARAMFEHCLAAALAGKEGA